MWRLIAIFLIGAVLGTGFGVAVGFLISAADLEFES